MCSDLRKPITTCFFTDLVAFNLGNFVYAQGTTDTHPNNSFPFQRINTVIRAAKNRFEIEIFLHTGDSITAERAARERKNKAAHGHNVHRKFVPILFFLVLSEGRFTQTIFVAQILRRFLITQYEKPTVDLYKEKEFLI